MNDMQRKKLTMIIVCDVALWAFYCLIFVGGWVSWTIYVILSALTIMGFLVTAVNSAAMQDEANENQEKYSTQYMVWNTLDAIVVVILILASPIPTTAGIVLALAWTGASIYVMTVLVSGTRLPRV